MPRRTMRSSPGSGPLLPRPQTTGSPATRWLVLVLCSLVGLWGALRALRSDGHSHSHSHSQAAAAPEVSASRPTPSAPDPTPRGSPAEEQVLAAALHEEQVRLGSGVLIERIEQDRDWVCEGEPIRLATRVSGEPEPGSSSRWVWFLPGRGAELQPGLALTWEAPSVAGSYKVRHQVVKDLGGRRVGVLAERVVAIEVRPCQKADRQAEEPLRIEVAQTGHGAFTFRARAAADRRVAAHAWRFGDGTEATSVEPEVQHRYALQDLRSQESRAFTVRLEARLASGERLTSTTFIVARGRPERPDKPPVELAISRWRPTGDGGFESDITVRNPTAGDITWESLERVTQYLDDHTDTATRPWREQITVTEPLLRGGFRGQVRVEAREAAPPVKQIHDFLYGRDASGTEVVVSWTPFKRAPSP